MSSNTAIVDALTSRQIFIERYSKGEAKRLAKHLVSMSGRLKKMVSNDYERVRAVRLARQVSRLADQIIKEYGADLVDGLEKFARNEAEFARQAIVASTSAEAVIAPSLNQIQSAITKRKMTLLEGKSSRTYTVDQAIKQFSKSKSKEIANIIRDGATVGTTLEEIVDSIGAVSTRSRIQAESIVRTTTNHIASVARSATYKANSDVITGEEYTAVLDGRTTITCSSLDGRVFDIGKGPHPPLHWSCRSVRVPIINPKYDLGSAIIGERSSVNGSVSAQVTYGGWLKRQSANVQDEVLGVERAKLFRSGKLSIGKFTDDSGRVYNLSELEKLNPLAFN